MSKALWGGWLGALCPLPGPPHPVSVPAECPLANEMVMMMVIKMIIDLKGRVMEPAKPVVGQ